MGECNHFVLGLSRADTAIIPLAFTGFSLSSAFRTKPNFLRRDRVGFGQHDLQLTRQTE